MHGIKEHCLLSSDINDTDKFGVDMQWRLLCRHCGTVASLFSRYISFLDRFVVLLRYLDLYTQEVLTMCLPRTKCFARGQY